MPAFEMSEATAERWVVVSALVVAGIYAYRRIAEPTASPSTLKNVLGQGDPPPLGQWATAWGTTYLVVAIMATASPGLGGAFAVLIMAADLLANLPALIPDIGKAQSGKLAGGGQGLAQQIIGSGSGAASTGPAAGNVTSPSAGGGSDIVAPAGSLAATHGQSGVHAPGRGAVP